MAVDECQRASPEDLMPTCPCCGHVFIEPPPLGKKRMRDLLMKQRLADSSRIRDTRNFAMLEARQIDRHTYVRIGRDFRVSTCRARDVVLKYERLVKQRLQRLPNMHDLSALVKRI